MSEQSVVNATFTLEREYPVAPAAVFAAWADPATKARWFAGGNSDHELDFRVGGREIARGAVNDTVITFETVYRDIVPDTRIVYTSSLSEGEILSTVSLTTVEFAATDSGTRLTLTEHGAYLDGREQPAWREQGTDDQLTALAEVLAAVVK
ncbi:SRPBCC domain-containing protein [Nocardia jiangxiensis]|uniref:SRPBCC domain-containing protein n=1 Tax=Nocardia jiangxiensis TaxID=282685 RepID=A0ABW6RVA7_9NOCA|nr:SRPBCC domain-containing protein [Nocardia jiangxiensis]